MSGIVGALALKSNSFRVTEPYLVRMRDTMARRGPDGAGLWISGDGRIGLAHRRLRTIDLSDAAAQPMSNSEKTLWVCCDGEIYNHAEVREELRRLGHRTWATDHADTEVVLRAFEQWGIAGLEKLNGAFALAIWDSLNRRLWLARDRLGVKPLYYSIHNGRVVFASAISALLADPDQKRAVNEEAFYHYLSFQATPTPDTMFEGVTKLAGGTWVRIDETGEVARQRYWEVWDHTKPRLGVSQGEVVELVRHELERAIKLQSVGDVPVGTFLSSGLDSNLNAAFLARAVKGPINTFTYCFDKADLEKEGGLPHRNYRSESDNVRRVAEALGYKNRTWFIGLDDVIGVLPQMVEFQEEPISDPHCASFYFLANLARNNGLVVDQMAIGADELFLGQPKWPTWHRLQRMNDWPVPRALKKLALAGLGMSGRGDTFPYERLRRAAAGEAIFWNGNEMFTDAQKKRLISPRLRRKFRTYTSYQAVEPIRERFQDKAWEQSHVHWMTFMDLNLHTSEHHLMRNDKMMMAAGHQTRSPFLDYQLVELMLSIPEQVHLNSENLNKPILERIAAQLIPDGLITRAQGDHGFPYAWLFGRLGDVAFETLDAFCRRTDYLDHAAVTALIEQMRANRDLHKARQCWCLLTFALWWNRLVSHDAA